MALSCNLDFEFEGPPYVNKCTSNDVTYDLGDINPNETCLKCAWAIAYGGSYNTKQWVNRVGGGACVDGVFHKDSAYIGGVLYPSGTINPDNECEICETGYEWNLRRGCCIDSVFYERLSLNPENPCEECVPEYSSGLVLTDYWTPVSRSTPCPGGNCDGEGNCN